VDSLDEARTAFEQAVKGYGNSNLEVAEVMEFANNYYAEVKEKDTGIGAMELLIDKQGSQVYPEPGPNMMWNTKYGMMAGSGSYGRMMGPNGTGMMHGSRSSSSAQTTTGTRSAKAPTPVSIARRSAAGTSAGRRTCRTGTSPGPAPP